MLTKCVNCGFYVRQTDEFCSNCGFLKLTEYDTSKKFNHIRFALITLILIVVSAIALILFSTSDNLSTIIVQYSFVVVISLIISFAFNLIKETFDKNKGLKNRQNRNPDNLTNKQTTIGKRIAELNKRAQKIDSVSDKIRETDGRNLQEIRQKLLAAREIVMSQYARYELQNQKINLVRLQNGVSPYLFALHRLNESEIENGIWTIESTQKDIDRMWQNLMRHDAIDFPAQTLPEKAAFLAQIEETEESCQRLREALVSRQAARALQDISPIEENLKLSGAKEIVRETDVFNIQATLTDFSESFEELEREYRRLKTEEETGQKLLVE